MANYSPISTGLGSSAAYQVAGKPYLTGSTVNDETEATVTFPTVTRSITVICTGSEEIRVHFDSTGSAPAVITGKHYISLQTSASYTFDVKCVNLYVTAPNGQTGFELAAELTSVQPIDMYTLTGSGVNASNYDMGGLL